MKLRFDASLVYQLEALAAITDLFDGMGPGGAGNETGFSFGALLLTERCLANYLEMETDLLLRIRSAV